MTTFRLATLAAATALAFSLPAHAVVVNAPTVSGMLNGNAVLSLTFDVPTVFNLAAVTLTIDWPSAGLALDPAASTALSMSWPTLAAKFDPDPLFTQINHDVAGGQFSVSAILTQPLALPVASYTVGMSFGLLSVGSHQVSYGFDLVDTNGVVQSSITGSGLVNVSAVPEPASLALLLAGLGLVAGVARRRAH